MLWSPGDYERFSHYRDEPFFDLFRLVQGRSQHAVADLGCGSGRLTWRLHEALDVNQTLGVDNSPSMLTQARHYERPGLTFELDDIAKFDHPGFDLVFSNAALHWVPNHTCVLKRWTEAVRPGGELAFQVPANADHPSHLIAARLASESPFAEAFPSGPPPDPVGSVLLPEQYSGLLHSLGYSEQHVRLQIYGMELASSAEIVDWMRGASLTRFRALLSEDLFAEFLRRYRARLLETLGDERHYFYTYKRILAWARKPRS
jgi:trans-aconitate 2-methyltransferase